MELVAAAGCCACGRAGGRLAAVVVEWAPWAVLLLSALHDDGWVPEDAVVQALPQATVLEEARPEPLLLAALDVEEVLEEVLVDVLLDVLFDVGALGALAGAFVAAV